MLALPPLSQGGDEVIAVIDGKIKKLEMGTYKSGPNTGRPFYKVHVTEEGITHKLEVDAASYALVEKLTPAGPVGQTGRFQCDMEAAPVAQFGGNIKQNYNIISARFVPPKAA